MNFLIALVILLSDIPYHGEPVPEPITTRLYTAPFGCPQLGDPHKINGYYYQDPEYNGQCWQPVYYWNPGVPTYQSQYMRMPDISIGTAYAYETNLMEHTAMFHGLTLDDVKDGVALPFCSEIGNKVWLMRTSVGEWEGPFKVVDCAGLLDLYNVVVHRQEVVEVGFKTAVKWGMVKDIHKSGESWGKTWDHRRVDDVIVSMVDPKNLTIVHPVKLSDWFSREAVFFRTQAEWDNAYKPLFKSIDGVPSWRFEPNGQWITFKEH